MTRNEIKSFTLKIWIFTNVVMCRTPFYRTSNQTQTFSSIGDQTQTPYFWLRMIKHRTSNLIWPSLDLLNCLLIILGHHFFKHRTNLNVLIFWELNLNTLFFLFLALNDRTSNLEHN